MSVAVQQMVLPKAAGVAFTLEPDQRRPLDDRDRLGVRPRRVGGLGHGHARQLHGRQGRSSRSPSARCRPRNWSAVSWPIESCERPLDADRSTVTELTDDEIKADRQAGPPAEKHFGRPQDVEWAVTVGADGHRPCICCRAVRRRCGATSRAGEPRCAHRSRRGRQQPAEARASQAMSTTQPLGEHQMSKDRFVSPFSMTTPPGARAGRSCTPTTCSSARRARNTRRRSSGSPTASTGHRPPAVRHQPGRVSRSPRSASTTGATTWSRRRTGIDYRVHNGYFYMSPVPRRGGGDPRRVSEHSSSAPGTTSPTGTRSWQNWIARSRRSSASSRR